MSVQSIADNTVRGRSPDVIDPSGPLAGMIGESQPMREVYDLTRRFVSMVDRKDDDGLKSMSSVWCFFGEGKGAAVLALLPSHQPVMVGDQEYLGILVPTAPVPIGGGLIYVPASWVVPADIGMDQLMSIYVSMGVTAPKGIGAPRSPVISTAAAAPAPPL